MKVNEILIMLKKDGCYLVSTRGSNPMRYAIVVEKTRNNYSAYVPDLPGCIATGYTIEETEQEIQEAIKFHIEGMIEDGLLIPQPTSIVQYIEIAV